MVFVKADLDDYQEPDCHGIVCNFLMILDNRTTLTIYSQTILQITLSGGNQEIIPNLEPATLPICNNNLQPAT